MSVTALSIQTHMAINVIHFLILHVVQATQNLVITLYVSKQVIWKQNLAMQLFLWEMSR